MRAELSSEDRAEYMRLRRLAFPELFRNHRILWRTKNRAKYLEQSQRAAYKRKYGISLEERDRLLQQNGGICPVCLAAPAEHIDHDHDTNEVRGALCLKCNVGIGMLRDCPEVLARAIKHLEAI